VAELAALEMLCTGNRTVGSNPTLSAIALSSAREGALVSGALESPIRRDEKMRLKLRWRLLLAFVILAATFCSTASFDAAHAQGRRRRRAPQRSVICGNPTAHCSSADKYRPFDLPFSLPKRAVVYETQPFYAIVLQSVRMRDYDDCDHFVPEESRLAAQALFPNNKVFASRCAIPGDVYYMDVSDKAQFMAVYAGESMTEARRVLELVRATNKYPGANIRRMRASFMGT
jgi:hypothetical protein